MALDFSYSVSGLVVSFRILSKVPADQTPVWDFGDNTELVAGSTPEHTYETAGFYTVTLKLIEPSTEEETDSTSDTVDTEESEATTVAQSDEEETSTDTNEESTEETETTEEDTSDTEEEEEEPIPVPEGETTATRVRQVIVSEYAKTHLTDTIYNLVDNYIPSNLSIKMTQDEKDFYFNKWQLYIQPLVNHEIPIEEYSNELYYEGLENQLIMELAAYDYLYVRIENMLVQTAAQLEANILADNSEEESESEGNNRIKQITTGPTEVQYFDSVSESISSLFKAYAQATQPGGILDDLRKNLCMLANRMEIFLPMCDHTRTIVVPKIGNHRHAGLIGGPNPGRLVHIPKDNLL